MTIRAVFFDIDGTLVDSNDFHVLAWEEAFESVGARFDRQVVHDQIGKGTDMLVPTLLPDLTDAEVDRLGELHGDIFQTKYLGKVRAFPDAHALLARVHDAGMQIVFASSAGQSELTHYLGLLDAHDLVSTSTSADDVQNTKPAPDIFAVALEKVGLTAEEVIVVGDTPYDIEAAGKCGLMAIAVRSGGFSDEVLRSTGAIKIYDGTADLLASFDKSPLVK